MLSIHMMVQHFKTTQQGVRKEQHLVIGDTAPGTADSELLSGAFLPADGPDSLQGPDKSR